jgi:hypothetical protein
MSGATDLGLALRLSLALKTLTVSPIPQVENGESRNYAARLLLAVERATWRNS